MAQVALDVLVYPDLGMEPLSYFMAFARLAPVQVRVSNQQAPGWALGRTTLLRAASKSCDGKSLVLSTAQAENFLVRPSQHEVKALLWCTCEPALAVGAE